MCAAMKAILHIGTPKTATTHVQSTFMANRQTLQRAGIVYPDLLNKGPDHITLFCAAHPYLHPFQDEYGIRTRDEIAPFRDNLRQLLQKQVAADPTALFILSSENLSGNLQGQAGMHILRELLTAVFDDIKVVVYLRRQDEALLSMYAEFMRKGFSGPTFDRFIERNLSDTAVVPYLDYDRLLRTWANVFGQENLVPRIFESQRFVGGTVVSDFLSLLPGLPAGFAAGLQARAPANTSLSAPALEFLRLIQGVVPFGFKGNANPERAALMPRINALPQLPKPVMSHVQAARIMAHYMPGNQKVAETYFAGGTAALFAQDVRSSDASNLGELSLAQFREYFHAVFG